MVLRWRVLALRAAAVVDVAVFSDLAAPPPSLPWPHHLLSWPRPPAGPLQCVVLPEDSAAIPLCQDGCREVGVRQGGPLPSDYTKEGVGREVEYSPEGRQLSISDNCPERERHTHTRVSKHTDHPPKTSVLCMCVWGWEGNRLATVLAESSMGRPGARCTQRRRRNGGS